MTKDIYNFVSCYTKYVQNHANKDILISCNFYILDGNEETSPTEPPKNISESVTLLESKNTDSHRNLLLGFGIFTTICTVVGLALICTREKQRLARYLGTCMEFGRRVFRRMRRPTTHPVARQNVNRSLSELRRQDTESPPEDTARTENDPEIQQSRATVNNPFGFPYHAIAGAYHYVTSSFFGSDPPSNLL